MKIDITFQQITVREKILNFESDNTYGNKLEEVGVF